MKIYDCFLFHNEIKILELRMNILYKYVDYFVIVESAITFQGDKKDYNFEKYKEHFKKFQSKIIYYKIPEYKIEYSDLPYIVEPKKETEKILNDIYKYIDGCNEFNKDIEFWWGNDFYQRESIWLGLESAGAKYGDMILLSDVDEIPSPESLLWVKKNICWNMPMYFQQHEFCYYLNYYHNSEWIGTSSFLLDYYANFSLNGFRAEAKKKTLRLENIVKNAGWHFTSIGNVESINNKIKSWGHREFNNALVLDNLKYHVAHGYDIFRRRGFGKLKYISIPSCLLPEYLNVNSGDFDTIIGPMIKKERILQYIFHNIAYITRAKTAGVRRRVSVLIKRFSEAFNRSEG